MTSKDDILKAIRFHAAQNGGVPLGKNRFKTETGIKDSDWYGRYWARWNDAIVEAGLEPNSWRGRVHEKDALTRKLAEFVMELGSYPTHGDRGLRRRNDPSFPDNRAFSEHLGNRQQQLHLLMQFAIENPEYKDIYDICAPLVTSQPEKVGSETQSSSAPGRVYMIRSGDRYKIGKTDDPKRRYRDIQLLVPNELEEIHVLETDDPAGIELYWHRRFKNKRQKGEWFDLNASDIEAFKSRGKSM